MIVPNDSSISVQPNPAPTHECHKTPLQDCLQTTLDNYFKDLDGHPPGNLYQMVLSEVEQPLLQTVMRHTHGNQCKAAEILGINRSTLRKKLTHYKLD